jgi:hypothetical protein
MSQAQSILDPWILVWGQPYIDGQTLAAAIEQDLVRDTDPGVRTRLLVCDGDFTTFKQDNVSAWITARTGKQYGCYGYGSRSSAGTGCFAR